MKKMALQLQAKNITFKEGFEIFIKFKRIQNLSIETIKYYENCALSFTNYLESEKMQEIQCEEITEELIWGYIEWEQQRGIKAITVNSYLRGMRAILYYLMKKGYCNKFDVLLIRAEKPIKETYTDGEINLLLKKPQITTKNFVEYRTWVHSTILLGTGIRISSSLNIKISDVKLSENEIVIRKSKNRKQQILPISVSLNKILTEYINVRGGEPDDYLICNQFGYQLNVRTAQDSIRDYNHSRGVMKASAHLYRHTFAKLWILNGGDIFTLQKMLGHSSLEMVKEYVEFFSKELNVKYQMYNPLDSYIKNREKIKLHG